MARNLYYILHGKEMVELYKKHQESYRERRGTLRQDILCDICGKPVPTGVGAIAVTSHPRGHEVVMPWEDEYLDMAESPPSDTASDTSGT